MTIIITIMSIDGCEIREEGTKGRCLLTKRAFVSDEPIIVEERSVVNFMYQTDVLSQQERQLIELCSGDVKRVELVMLASRLLSAMKFSSEVRKQVSTCCKPSIITSSQQKRLQTLASVCVDVLQKAESEASCIDVMMRLSCNIFTIVDTETNDPLGVGFFPLSSSINHSCESNASVRYGVYDITLWFLRYKQPSGILYRFTESRLSVVADREIHAGEEVTISYTNTSKPTWSRRHSLLLSYYFNCNCTRCSTRDRIDGFKCLNQGCPGVCCSDSETKIDLGIDRQDFAREFARYVR